MEIVELPEKDDGSAVQHGWAVKEGLVNCGITWGSVTSCTEEQKGHVEEDLRKSLSYIQ